VLVGSVIGFPAGNSAIEVKAFETEKACKEGAVEIDMVINIGKVLQEDWNYIEREIEAVVDTSHKFKAITKVIFETDYITKDEHKIKLCEICTKVGAEYVKTSTGFVKGAKINMRKIIRFLIACLVVILSHAQSFSQVKIIFDTDLGGDADDLGALAMLNNFIEKKECELLAVMCWSTEQYAVSAIDAVNRFYNHPNIPIGTRKDSIYYEPWNYSKSIADNFPHQLNYEKAIEATVLYRKLLTKSKNKSIIIVTVGPLKNIENLIESGPDSISPLTGKQLIEKKVKEFVMMGGQFPEGKSEWNFNGNMPGVTKFVIQNIDIPITFSGYEVGDIIKTGALFNEIDHKTPLYVGFRHFSEFAPWIKSIYQKDRISNNSTYDQTAVLYAVREGTGLYWDKISDGRCVPDETGGNKWVKSNKSKHSYLKLKMDKDKLAKEIENFMLNKF
jgi:inosine-uridine nucleoside N-ribohydrolase